MTPESVPGLTAAGIELDVGFAVSSDQPAPLERRDQPAPALMKAA